MLARRFLYAIAAVIVLVLAAGIGWSLLQDRLLRLAFVPGTSFAPMADSTAPDYAKAAGWLARPDLADDPSRWRPPGAPRSKPGAAAVFYIAPTTYLSRDHWNGAFDDAAAEARLQLFARSEASAFTAAGSVWAPRYRQATLGAFLAAGDPRAQAAIDFAYRDVARAFDVFLAGIPADRPIILAGHSQGTLHLLRLLRERVAGTPLARRIVAVYAVGWPISVSEDLPALGIPACARADQAGCVLAWQSFAEPATPTLIDDYFARSAGFSGRPRAGTAMLCIDPLTGTEGGAAPRSANIGSLVPRPGLAGADLVVPGVPARCSRGGLLLIGPPPGGYGAYVLPGNNYHVFDYALFWANIRADAAARLKAYRAR